MTAPEPVLPGPAPAPERRRERDTGSFVIWYLGVSSLALVALIVIVVILVTRLDRVTGDQQQASVTQCQLNNVTRQQDIAIWTRFLADLTPPAAKLTPQIRAELAQIDRLVVVKDTPRDCSAA